MDKEQLQQGITLLSQPVLPLVSMVQFFLFTGDFAAVGDILRELPDPIETDFACYKDPAALLAPYEEDIARILHVQNGAELPYKVVNEAGQEVDNMTATAAIVTHTILTRELEQINSALCAPCNCRLCCVGPEQDMEQEFFEIPLGNGEREAFSVAVIDNAASRGADAMDESPLLVDEQPFYMAAAPAAIHWQKGWSLILPKGSSCPNLELESGRCTVYPVRPQVCRKPQIFPYILEPVVEQDGTLSAQAIRNTILAVVDCPYVQVLQDEIAAYAAACELDLIFKQNKG
ncbi:MAG: hypothetical protein CSB34_00740 [Desulfobulbus propionicus]|nr:MAG: hypothetical protein CSB34_00740 [Desulfobulbus propionicus]